MMVRPSVPEIASLAELLDGARAFMRQDRFVNAVQVVAIDEDGDPGVFELRADWRGGKLSVGVRCLRAATPADLAEGDRFQVCARHVIGYYAEIGALSQWAKVISCP